MPPKEPPPLSPADKERDWSYYTSISPPTMTKEHHRRAMSFGLLRSRSKSPRPPPPLDLAIPPPSPQKSSAQSSKLGYHRTAVACGHCRRRKIRCIPTFDDPGGRCQSCIRLKKDCHFFPVDQQHAFPGKKYALDDRTIHGDGDEDDKEVRPERWSPVFYQQIQHTSASRLPFTPESMTYVAAPPNQIKTGYDEDWKDQVPKPELDIPVMRSRSSSPARSSELFFDSDGERSFVKGDDSISPSLLEDMPQLGHLISHIATELVVQYTAQGSSIIQASDPCSQETSPGSSSHPVSINSDWNSATTQNFSYGVSRRRTISNEEEEEDEDSRPRKMPQASKKPESGIGSKPFACPYAKHDPQRYSERNINEINYRKCSSCFLRGIPRLKQHLYRVHRQPEHHCVICYEEFESGDSLKLHTQQRSCEDRPSPFDEKMTQDQVKVIKRRQIGKCAEATWFDIYSTLFPESPLPQSPYNDTEHALTLQDFAAFLEGPGRAILASEIERGMFPPTLPDINSPGKCGVQGCGLRCGHGRASRASAIAIQADGIARRRGNRSSKLRTEDKGDVARFASSFI